MKTIFTAIIIGVSALSVKAQNYTVSPVPTQHIDTTNVYTDYYFNITNLTSNQLALSWEILSNSILPGWTYNVCDYQACYLQATLPTQRDMDLIPANATSGVYLKLGVNTNNIVGNGVIKFFLYETGNNSVGDTLVYDITCMGTLGLDDLAHEGAVNLYPNPANDFIYMEFGNVTTASARITNQSGALVKELNVEGKDQFKVDVSEYAPGIYFVTLSSDHKTVVKKFIVR